MVTLIFPCYHFLLPLEIKGQDLRLQSDFVDSYGHMEHNSTEQWQCFYLIFFSIYIFFSFKHIPLTSIICLQKMMTAMLHAQWAGVRIIVLKKCTVDQEVNLCIFLIGFLKSHFFTKWKLLIFSVWNQLPPHCGHAIYHIWKNPIMLFLFRSWC